MPSSIAEGTPPGMPNRNVGMRSPASTELLALSGPTMPRGSPLPNWLVLGRGHRLAVRQPGAGRRADAGKDAGPDADEGTAEDVRPVRHPLPDAGAPKPSTRNTHARANHHELRAIRRPTSHRPHPAPAGAQPAPHNELLDLPRGRVQPLSSSDTASRPTTNRFACVKCAVQMRARDGRPQSPGGTLWTARKTRWRFAMRSTRVEAAGSSSATSRRDDSGGYDGGSR